MIFLEIILAAVLLLLCLRSYFAIQRLEKLEHNFNKLVELTSDITKTLNGIIPLVETSLGIDSGKEINDISDIPEAEVTEVEESNEEEGE